jgi:hypothetical protein
MAKWVRFAIVRVTEYFITLFFYFHTKLIIFQLFSLRKNIVNLFMRFMYEIHYFSITIIGNSVALEFKVIVVRLYLGWNEAARSHPVAGGPGTTATR